MKLAGVKISNPDKVIFPKPGITKGELAEYYLRIAKHLLPHLKNRPLTLQRFPDGITKEGFYQKEAADYFPDFIETVPVPTQKGSNKQVVCNSEKTLLYLANQATISFHTWMSTTTHLHKPNKIVFDLDPPAEGFEKVKQIAQILRAFLKEKGHSPQLMTSGKTGLHLYYNIHAEADFDNLRPTLKKWCEELAQQHPQLMTTEMRKEDRQGRVFLDFLRNAYGQTSICPYSLRPNQQGAVATPIEWSELDRLQSADQYHMKNIFRRLAQK